jgi:hypothetical protein
MGGGLMQLVAYGAQDIYLTGNPQITFFKVVYRRHTNFSMEAIAQSFNGTPSVPTTDSTGTASATISRNGDLIHKMYVVVEAKDATAGTITNGSKLVHEAELEIGGQKIDKHWADWNQVWNELSTPESKAIGLKSMQGDIGSTGSTGVGMIQIPLNFWFCRNPGLALPLIALQYHEVKVQLTLAKPGSSTVAASQTAKLFVDYIYLDTDERRRFAQVSHEYLIEQIQRQAISKDQSQKLVFNHPVKELIWTTPTTSYTTGDYGTAQLKLNGHDRFSKQQEEYFRLRQPFDYHTAVPRQNLPSAGQGATVGMSDLTSLFSGIDLAESTPGVYAEDGNTAVVNKFTALTSAGASAGSGVAGARKFIQLLKAEATDFTVNDRVLVQFGDVGTPAKNFSVITTVVSLTVTATTTAVEFTDDVHDGVNSANGGATLSVNKIAASAEARTSQDTQKVSVYSFALKPEEHQPSGTCNFSRIDTAILEFGNAPTGTSGWGYVYAVNYNVLRIMSGMGGLAYSN